MAWSLALVWSLSPREAAHLRVSVAPDGTVHDDTATLAGVPSLLEDFQRWEDPAYEADNTQYTRWTFTYQGCLSNYSIGSGVKKKKVRKPMFDAYACKNFCGDEVQTGDRIALHSMFECYCLPAAYKPDLTNFSWADLQSSSDTCEMCERQTPSGCMVSTVQLPCSARGTGFEATCETCHADTFGKQYKEYCDTSCRNPDPGKCGHLTSTDVKGQTTVSGIAIYELTSEVVPIETPSPTPQPCFLNEFACKGAEEMAATTTTTGAAATTTTTVAATTAAAAATTTTTEAAATTTAAPGA